MFSEINLYEGLKFTYNLGLDIDNTTRSVLYNAFYGQYSSQCYVFRNHVRKSTIADC